MEEFERLSSIKPWKNAKFNLNRIAKTPKGFTVDKEIHDKLRDGIDDLRRDGASHILTTFKIDEGDVYDIDATMNNKNYFFRVKFIIKMDNGNRVIKDKLEPILTEP